MKTTVILRGGPLDGHLYEVDNGQRVAYILHRVRSLDELARLGFASPDGALPTLLLVYKATGPDSPVWRFLGGSDRP